MGINLYSYNRLWIASCYRRMSYGYSHSSYPISIRLHYRCIYDWSDNGQDIEVPNDLLITFGCQCPELESRNSTYVNCILYQK